MKDVIGARVAYGVLAAVGWIGLIVQLFVSIGGMHANGYSTFDAVTTYLSFFTIWTNLLVAVASTAVAAFPSTRLGTFFRNARTQTALATYVTLVWLVYTLLLRHLFAPTGAALLADEILHDVVPLLEVAWWAIFVAKRDLRFVDVATWVLFPILYGVYALIRGAVVHHYTYPFIDASALGYAVVARNVVGFVIAFFILGSIFVGIAMLTAARRHPTAP